MRPHTRTHCTKMGDCEGEARCTRTRARDNEEEMRGEAQISLLDLPTEIILKILQYISFKEHAALRMVCCRMNEMAAGRLNSTFYQLLNRLLTRFQAIKMQMPRRESARRNHPLYKECDVLETMHMRLTLLQMTFGRHIERKHICFFPGEVLDEVYKILAHIQSAPRLDRAFKETEELHELGQMAMEYFKETLEPSLPEITYFGTDFLDFTPPFASPLKKVSRTSGLDSPISSRASAVGSSCSEPPLSYTHLDGDVDEEGGDIGGGDAPQSNMVLRKRIKRIRAGMKKYNTQLDEVKRELKSCKSKMDGQSKQVAEYSSRLDEYDKKFEENSRKFGTLLTELNKCKTELQFYRSRSHLQYCQNCGSSLTDQASDSANTDQVSFPSIEGVDKQAMVEDWLNPDLVYPGDTAFRGQSTGCRAPSGHRFCVGYWAEEGPREEGEGAYPAPSQPDPNTVQLSHQLNLTNMKKNSKTEDEGYLRSGPGSPGYTRAGPRSPGSPGSPGPSGVRKRKSRDEEERRQCLRGHHVGTRPKRPKQTGQL